MKARQEQLLMNQTITKIPFTQRIEGYIPILFGLWLLVTVIGPHKVHYRYIYYGLALPAVLVLLWAGRSRIDWKDPFLRLFILFALYTGISTFLVGSGPMEDDVRKFRWGLEASLGMIAFFVWMPWILRSPLIWGRLFLWFVVLGSLGGFVLTYLILGGKRVSGLGALYNPIQASSILLVYFAIGHFLLSETLERWSWRDGLLLVVSIITGSLFIILSQSRAPIIVLLAYAVFLAALSLVRGRNRYLLAAFVLCPIAVWIGLHMAVDPGEFLQKLIERGFSQRIEIWKGYLMYPPESLLLGYGAGTEPDYMVAAEEFWRPNNYLVTHAHNIWLAAFAETGLIGLSFQLAIFAVIVWKTMSLVPDPYEKLKLLGILGLVVLLTMTSEHTLITSIKPIWLFGWLPMAFVWLWACHYDGNESKR
jgi:O-antigen ligase